MSMDGYAKVEKAKPIVTAHPGGWELGIAVGYNKLYTGQLPESGQAGPTPAPNHDNNNLQWGVHGAYWWPLSPRWLTGVELGYQNLGSAEYSYKPGPTEPTNYFNLKSAQAIDLLFELRYYLSDHWLSSVS